MKSLITATTSTTAWIPDCFRKMNCAAHVRIWAQAARLVKKEHGDLPDECRRYFIIRTIIDLQIKDVVGTSETLIRAAGVQSADDVRLHAKPLIRYSAERRELNIELRRYLYKNLYFNSVVNEPHIRAKRILRELFQYLFETSRRKSATGPQAASRRWACTAPCATTSPA